MKRRRERAGSEDRDRERHSHRDRTRHRSRERDRDRRRDKDRSRERRRKHSRSRSGGRKRRHRHRGDSDSDAGAAEQSTPTGDKAGAALQAAACSDAGRGGGGGDGAGVGRVFERDAVGRVVVQDGLQRMRKPDVEYKTADGYVFKLKSRVPKAGDQPQGGAGVAVGGAGAEGKGQRHDLFVFHCPSAWTDSDLMAAFARYGSTISDGHQCVCISIYIYI